MHVGDRIGVQLRKHPAGRVGEIARLADGDDDWEPTVPKSKNQKVPRRSDSHHVRWDFATDPFRPDVVAQRPKAARLTTGEARSTLTELRRATFEKSRTR
jgi:hypothetical protein